MGLIMLNYPLIKRIEERKMSKVIRDRCPEGDLLVIFRECHDLCEGCPWYDTCKKEAEKDEREFGGG